MIQEEISSKQERANVEQFIAGNGSGHVSCISPISLLLVRAVFSHLTETIDICRDLYIVINCQPLHFAEYFLFN